MLWFIGLGMGISELSNSTLEVIRNAEIVYLESFNSPISETEKKQLEDISGGEFKTAKRWLVEDGNEIWKMQKQGNSVNFIRRSIHRNNTSRTENTSD